MTNKDRLLMIFRKTMPSLGNDIKMYRLIDSHTLNIELYSGHTVKFTYFSKDHWELQYAKRGYRKETSDESARETSGLRSMRKKVSNSN